MSLSHGFYSSVLHSVGCQLCQLSVLFGIPLLVQFSLRLHFCLIKAKKEQKIPIQKNTGRTYTWWWQHLQTVLNLGFHTPQTDGLIADRSTFFSCWRSMSNAKKKAHSLMPVCSFPLHHLIKNWRQVGQVQALLCGHMSQHGRTWQWYIRTCFLCKNHSPTGRLLSKQQQNTLQKQREGRCQDNTGLLLLQGQTEELL